MVENGFIAPLLAQEPCRNRWGEPEQEEPRWGEPVPAAVEVASDDLAAESAAGTARKLSLSAVVEGDGPGGRRFKAWRRGEELGEFHARRIERLPLVGRTKYRLEQC